MAPTVLLRPDDVDHRSRLHVKVQGAVQGVGFRPFVYRLASEMGLVGWVLNSANGVFIEVEGAQEQLECFLRRLHHDAPPRALIQHVESAFLPPAGFTAFEIRHSENGGARSALILPDVATCPDCLRDIFDPANRRYRYPFTNCTNCGPRYSIIDALPYDRATTTMRAFRMCDRCEAEYENPRDRRFHAQPNACPLCGPFLELWDGHGQLLASHDEALRGAVDAIRRGAVVAIKGLGGFQLLVDARNEEAVQLLRRRKHRAEKPLAIMAPALGWVRRHCELSTLEEQLLLSPEAPIVLLRRHTDSGVAPSVAPGNPYLGVMLPYTPLHHLLLGDLAFPVVATSGNLSDEPICIAESAALVRLHGVADLFLTHNRPIARQVDDSVVRVMAGEVTVLRRARGYAPLPIPLAVPAVHPLLAVGGQQKNTIALAVGRNAFLSQHIGDLEAAEAADAFRHVIGDFERLYEASPAAIARDTHPDYHSTHYATSRKEPVIAVQHHHAHILSCMAEHGITPPLLGVAWDGTGHGPDGTVWGGEFLRLRPEVLSGQVERVAHLRPFRLPGGEKAVHEPRRSALGLLFELSGATALATGDLAPVRSFREGERAILSRMLERGLNAPYTSSMGRLFDAVAALLDLRQQVTFEGQAACELEWLAGDMEGTGGYSFPVVAGAPGTPLLLDWDPLVQEIISDVRRGRPPAEIAAAFHHALIDALVRVAETIGEPTVVLTGGCFQNRVLLEQAVARLEASGFRPYWHHQVPPNDGGIALGQVVAALEL